MAFSYAVDVSNNQATHQPWATFGVHMGIAKASEGQHSHDAWFARHIADIKGAGLIPAGYHFAWPNQSAGAEAANYISAVRSAATGSLFVHILDLEAYPNGAKNYVGVNAAEIRAYAAAWVAAVRKAFPGQRIGIYTSGTDIAAGHLPGTEDFLWYPAYPVQGRSFAQAAAALRPAPSGRTVWGWQFTSVPRDQTVIYLSPAALRAWAAGTAETVQEEDVELTDAQIDKIATAVRNKIMNEATDDPSIADDKAKPTADDKAFKAIVWGIGRDAAHADAKADTILTALAKLAGALGADPAAFSAAVADDLAKRLQS
jgi:GH25 family lysozyme M1 (1,4-beta-N-acetylmuramidase)